MYVVRNVFQARPGKAKELVAKFKAAAPHLAAAGIRNTRILTDVAAVFWTVEVEAEVDSLQDYIGGLESGLSPAAREAMAGYMELVQGGRRVIYRIE